MWRKNRKKPLDNIVKICSGLNKRTGISNISISTALPSRRYVQSSNHAFESSLCGLGIKYSQNDGLLRNKNAASAVL